MPMKPIERRVFLTRGSVVVAAAGVAAAVSGLGPGLLEPAGAASAARGAGPADEITLDEPLVVHARDLTTGEIGLFSGTQEIVVHDRHLAGLLVQAAR
jgi:hypothetical protein